MSPIISGISEKNQKANLLEQGRSKLLLGKIPRGKGITSELNTRFNLWKQSKFCELLCRIEEQDFHRTFSRSQSTQPCQSRAKVARAANLAKNGAYRKGVASLVTGLTDLDAD